MAIRPVSMENISPVSVAPTVTNTNTSNDTKNIQSQITSKQQSLKKISSDDTITATEKEEKRREIQKEIDELHRKLELKKQEQEEKAKEAAKKQEQAATLRENALKQTTSDDTTAATKPDESSTTPIEKTKRPDTAPQDTDKEAIEKAEEKPVDMSVKDIHQMLSADYLVQKERVQEQVDVERKNAINVMEAEIAQDKIYGTDTTRKEAELKSLQEKENFWSNTQKQESEHTKVQTAMNASAKVVVDQI